MSNKPNEEIIELQLGDIIKIFNPVNDRLNDQTFIIDYLDKTKIILGKIDSKSHKRLSSSLLSDLNSFPRWAPSSA